MTTNVIEKSDFDLKKSLEDAFKFIPTVIKNFLSYENVKIRFDNLKEEFIGELLVFQNYSVISLSSSLFEGIRDKKNLLSQMVITILHEIGHLFDLTYSKTRSKSFIAENNKFKIIYDIEKHYFKNISNYNLHNDIEEFFAESFALFFVHPNALQKELPLTYRFITKMLYN